MSTQQETPATPRATQLAFAGAITDQTQRVVLIGADNSGAGHATLEEAVTRGGAYAVTVRNDMIALDADTDDQVAAVHLLGAEAHSMTLAPVMCKSGREGHLHLFLHCPSDTATAWRGRAVELGVTPRRHMRPPLSPHRLGLVVALLRPSSHDTALAALRGGNVAERPLSATTLARLRDGDDRYETRSELVMAVLVGMVNANKSPGWAWAALCDPGNVAGDKVRELIAGRGHHGGAAWFDRSWAAARRFVAANPARVQVGDDVAWRLAAIDAAGDVAAWPGLAGGSSRKVLAALTRIATSAKTLEFSASDRQVAERAGLGRHAANGALARLVDDGWVVRVRRGRGTAATVWCLNEVPASPPERARWSPGGRRSGPIAEVDHDMWRYAGLGGGGWRVARQLSKVGAATASGIAAGLEMNGGSVRRILTKLARVGVVARRSDSGATVWILTDTDPDLVAEMVGTAGAAERARRDHAHDRDSYHRARENRARESRDWASRDWASRDRTSRDRTSRDEEPRDPRGIRRGAVALPAASTSGVH